MVNSNVRANIIRHFVFASAC